MSKRKLNAAVTPPVASDSANPALKARAQAIRELIFEAQAIVDVTAAASASEAPVRWHGIRQALDVAYKILDKAASDLDAITWKKSEVSHDGI